MSENQQLATIRVLCVVGDAYEDLELWYPKLRIEVPYDTTAVGDYTF